MRDSTDRRETSVFRARSASRNVRQPDQCAQLLVDQQKDGDSPVKMVVQGLQERSRLKIMYGLRRFIMVDNHESDRVGDFERNMESRKSGEAEVHDRLS